MRYEVDAKTLHELEAAARRLAAHLDKELNGAELGTARRRGFMLFAFSFGGPEMTYISNCDRKDAIEAIKEWLARCEAGTADDLSRPRGRG